MATSGTVGQTTIDVSTIVEKAFRRCGKLASTISSELQLSARENLFLLLTDLGNRGLSLWCLQKQVLGVHANQIQFPLATGTVDVLTTLYRTLTTKTGDTISGAGWQGIDLGAGSEDAVYNVGVSFTAATNASLVLENSDDSLTWSTQVAFAPGAVAANIWICQDSENSTTARYWRLRDTSGTLPAVGTLDFNVDPYEIPMAKLSNDDYVALPNKTFAVPAGSKSLQFWFDKQIDPRLWIWPASQANVDQIVVWCQRHIQDVGAFSNTIDVPQRWLSYVIKELSVSCALEIPANELPEGRYEILVGERNEALAQAEDGESDGAPISIAPNIRGYTA